MRFMDMYTIEMLVADGNWSVAHEGNKKLPAGAMRHRRYEWSQSPLERWVPVGGSYATEAEADRRCAQFMACGSWAKPALFRVRYPKQE
jgi:hypothetical protein